MHISVFIILPYPEMTRYFIRYSSFLCRVCMFQTSALMATQTARSFVVLCSVVELIPQHGDRQAINYFNSLASSWSFPFNLCSSYQMF